MLGDSPINPVLLSMDLAATRRFYHDQIGLEIIRGERRGDRVSLRCRNESRRDQEHDRYGG